jgi:hypothetical protein
VFAAAAAGSFPVEDVVVVDSPEAVAFAWFVVSACPQARRAARERRDASFMRCRFVKGQR